MMNLFLNRVAFTIGKFEVYWYGIIMASAILVAFILAIFLYKKKGQNSTFAFETFLSVVIPGIVCARLFSVLMEEGTGITDFFKFREGGMSIIGAVIGGALGLVVLALVKKKNFFIAADVVAVVLILAQAIGRWGNYANQEVYGGVIESAKWQFFPFGVLIDGTWHYALFFYEFVFNLIGFGLLLFLLLKFDKKGLATGTYLLYYGTVRTLMEPLRENEFILRFKGIPISQAMSILMIIIGCIILSNVIINDIKERRQRKIWEQQDNV